MRNTLGKDERLKSRKKMEVLFQKGNSFLKSPIRVLWMFSDKELLFPAQIMFTVPKKSFKKSTDRNRIKRLMREAYRMNKGQIYEPLSNKGVYVIVAFIYTGNRLPEWKDINDKIILTLQRLAIDIEKSEEKKLES